MSTATLDPRLQLVPPGTRPRLWMFGLCVLLPSLVTIAALLAVSTGRTHWDFAGADPIVVGIAIIVTELVVLLAVWALLDRAMRRHRLSLSPTSLEIRTSFYSRAVPLSELKLGDARVLDLDERTEFKPGLKTNGYSLPGFHSGHFRLRNGDKAFLAVAGERRALWLPTTNGAGLLLQPQQPDALLNRLRELATTTPRR
ncbi:MAG: PH domain-containing protein [Pseudoxanthomonas sp.]